MTIINIAFFFLSYSFGSFRLPSPPSSTASTGEIVAELYKNFRLELMRNISFRTRACVVKTGGTGSVGISTNNFPPPQKKKLKKKFFVDLSMKWEKHQTRNFGRSNQKGLRHSVVKDPVIFFNFPNLNKYRRIYTNTD